MRVLPVIQYLIGDCKNHHIFCGRLSTHTLKTPWLCRDCNCPSLKADDENFECRFLTKLDFLGKTEDELRQMSHVKIRNAFYDLPMLDIGNVHSNTPPEALHAILLGPITYINRDLSFTKTGNDKIEKMFKKIYPIAKWQSERNLPALVTFRNGINSVKGLKADERFQRTFAVYLSLMNSYLIEELVKVQRKGGENPTVKNSLHFLFSYKETIEDCLLFYMWCKQREVLKTDVNPLLAGRAEESVYDNIMVQEMTRYGKEKERRALMIDDTLHVNKLTARNSEIEQFWVRSFNVNDLNQVESAEDDEESHSNESNFSSSSNEENSDENSSGSGTDGDYSLSSQDDISLNLREDLIFEIESLDSDYDESAQSESAMSSSSESAQDNISLVNDDLIMNLHDDIVLSTRSRADIRIETFFKLFKENVVLEGNEHKTTKFHQMMKHIPRYICKHGSFANFDGSRPEYFGKVMVKDHALTTNRSRKTINYDIAIRQTESNLFRRLLRIAQNRNKRDLNLSKLHGVSKSGIRSKYF